MNTSETSFLRGKKVLVAGGAGLLGVNLTRYLLEQGVEVLSTYYSRTPPEDLRRCYQRFDFCNFVDCLKATK